MQRCSRHHSIYKVNLVPVWVEDLTKGRAGERGRDVLGTKDWLQERQVWRRGEETGHQAVSKTLAQKYRLLSTPISSLRREMVLFIPVHLKTVSQAKLHSISKVTPGTYD